jgi:uncharacterized protein (DUF58 family)
MRPASRLLTILAVMVVLSSVLIVVKVLGLSSFVFWMAIVWWTAFFLVAVSTVVDWRISVNELDRLQASRITPGSLALGVDNKIILRINNHLPRSVHLVVTDDYPDEVTAVYLPRLLDVSVNSDAVMEYNVHPVKRGEAVFGYISLRVHSRMGLWQFLLSRGKQESVKIYPNFRSIVQYKTLGLHHHIRQIGIHLMPRRGQGMDFHQLREFREGDSLNQVDWNATARMRKPIAREYQDERDQDIIFLLDCGRRMHNKETELSYFDHVLNAFLLTSYVALHQGDAVGLMTFAGNERWLPPVKGQNSINILLNQVYDLHSSTTTSDFAEAAQRLINTHKKRSLVIMITNLHNEDAEDLKACIRLVAKRHLIIVANLKEPFLQDMLQQDISHFESALHYAGAVDFVSKRHRLLEELRKQGVLIVDALPQQLHVSLINEYLALKRRGKI